VNGGWGGDSCAGSFPVSKHLQKSAERFTSFDPHAFERRLSSARELLKFDSVPSALMSANFIHTTPSLFPQVNTVERPKLSAKDILRGLGLTL
jgi:hypothetical protein